ncbi:Enolase-phosphatase E1 [Irineochytrium annulatum]|nr:Enolase-phosphatase E1 [Irineochytrium annulatum]
MPSPSYTTVLVDIEGTTTPISFVHSVLFPYVTANLDRFLNERWGDSELQAKVQELRNQAAEDVKNAYPGAMEVLPASHPDADAIKKSVAECVRWQVKADRKIGALKSFQVCPDGRGGEKMG